MKKSCFIEKGNGPLLFLGIVKNKALLLIHKNRNFHNFPTNHEVIFSSITSFVA